MIISTRGRYALRVMLDLAAQSSEGYIPLKEIARRQDISEKYLENVIKVLVENHLLTGLRGKGGGYRLTRSPDQYTLGQILQLAEGSLAPVASASTIFLATMTSSASLGIPLRPSIVDTLPSFITPIPESERSSQWVITGTSNIFEYVNIFLIRLAFSTVKSPSAMPTAPALIISPISEAFSPLQPMVILP